MIVYTVTAYRGNWEGHSYSVGVYSTLERAILAANIEEVYRGGKYRCQVLKWELDQGKPEYDSQKPYCKEIRVLEHEVYK